MKVHEDVQSLQRKEVDSAAAPEISYAVLGDSEVKEAKRLTTVRYLEAGYITEEDLNEEGLYEDEYDAHSVRHGVYKRDPETGAMVLIITCRQVQYDPDKGLRSFPIFNDCEADPTFMANIKLLRQEELGKMYEISALAEDMFAPSGMTLQLYRGMWQNAITEDHGAWLMRPTPALYRNLSTYFNGNVVRIGEDITHLRGEPAVPAILKPKETLLNMSLDILANGGDNFRRDILGFFTDGLNSGGVFTPEEATLLDRALSTYEDSVSLQK